MPTAGGRAWVEAPKPLLIAQAATLASSEVPLRFYKKSITYDGTITASSWHSFCFKKFSLPW